MRYCRFRLDGHTLYGQVEQNNSEPWITALCAAPEEDLAFRLEHGSEQARVAFTPMPLSAAELLPPVTPSKILCIGRNYQEHVREIMNAMPDDQSLAPVLFLKPPSSLLAPGGLIVRPPLAQRVDFEGELAIVIHKRASRIQAEQWREYVRGYTVANDVTARDLQYADGQWTRAKGFDSFCPVGPVVSDELDPANAPLQTRVNGELRQDGSTSQMLCPVPLLVAYLSELMTLEAGDLILTGTPAGIGMLEGGDQVEVSIEGIGALCNTVQ